MQLGHIPRTELGFWPTPIHRMPRLAGHLGGPDIWVKRDDQSGVAGGGNKIRKLEYIVGQALEEGVDMLITTGGPQSNHSRLTAAVAAQLGLDAVLVLRGTDPGTRTGNLLLDELLGAKIVFEDGEDDEAPTRRMDAVAAEARDRGKTPLVIPLGGSNHVGTLGYVSAVLELLGQLHAHGVSVDHMFLAAGSQGTAAGVYLGCQAAGTGAEVHLVSVARPADVVRQQTIDLARRTADHLGWVAGLDESVLHVYDGYIGEGYGAVTPEAARAIRDTARLEGIILDPVYTGKAMSGLMDQVARGTVDPGETVLFWHTGGMPGLFAIGLGEEPLS